MNARGRGKGRKFPYDKRVLITGGGSGLGRALALEFAKHGWKVAAADIDLERAKETGELDRLMGAR